MTYNKAATRVMIELVGFSPRCQAFANCWLSAWQGCELPPSAQFPQKIPKALLPLTMIYSVNAAYISEITYVGKGLKRAGAIDLMGKEWIALAQPSLLAERKRRVAAIMRGAILRTTREVVQDDDVNYFFETISLPIKGRTDDESVILNFVDWQPSKKSTLLSPSEVGRVPEVAEFIPVISVDLETSTEKVSKSLKPEERVKAISRAAKKFLLNFIAETMIRTPGLDPLDYIIAIAVGSANVSHIENDLALSRKYAGLIEPDYMRRGISRSGVARAVNIPVETVRRRINHLIEIGILIERKDGIVLSATNSQKIGARLDMMHTHAQLMDRMARDLKARGVTLG